MRVAALALAAAAAGCVTVDTPAEFATVGNVARNAATGVVRAATGPHLDPINADSYAMMPISAQLPPPAPHSLWQQGSRTFFNDQRATRIGDILTVRVSIGDSAELKNDTSRNRDGSSSVGLSSLFGKEEFLGRLLPPGGNFDPANLVGAEASSDASGSGSIKREEKIDLTLAATIAEVLPNGNLLVAGLQQVRVNGEMRELSVAGIVRPEDIAADNSIRHDQLAEARISYGGQGTLSAVQKPRWGQRVVDVVSPW
jgi:flagellar L-ring protein FlgH